MYWHIKYVLTNIVNSQQPILAYVINEYYLRQCIANIYWKALFTIISLYKALKIRIN